MQPLQQEIADQIEREIAAVISEKQNSNFYAHLGADNHCNNDLYFSAPRLQGELSLVP